MSRTIGAARTSLAIIALLAGSAAFAQRGGGGGGNGGGGGPPSGVGGGHFENFPGGGNSQDTGGSHWGNAARPDGAGRPALETRTSPRSLETNSHLSDALTRSLGKSGVTLPEGGLNAACQGFRNLGGCLSALHVAENLALPGGFDALKAEMTSGDKLSLGKAIVRLRPDADARTAEKRASKQARDDLEQANDAAGG